MPRYMLLMRGNQESFMKLEEEARRAIIRSHIEYSGKLEKRGVLLDGDGFSDQTRYMEKKNGGIEVGGSPYRGSKHQVSGFYLIETENSDTAVELARGCPAFDGNETVEVIPLGH